MAKSSCRCSHLAALVTGLVYREVAGLISVGLVATTDVEVRLMSFSGLVSLLADNNDAPETEEMLRLPVW